METRLLRRIAPVLHRWWGNPLLRHARRAQPFPWGVLRIVLVVLAIGGGVAAVLAWVFEWRLLGSLLMGLSFGAMIIPVLDAPVSSASRVAHQMQNPETDPRQLIDMDPREVSWGLALVTLWRLRWPIVVALAMTPALMVGTAHASVSDYRTWQESAQLLRAITPAGSSPYLPADGQIPYVRVAIQAFSAGLLPWGLLALLAASGVTAALYLEDSVLSVLAALLAGAALTLIAVGLWYVLMVTPLLAGSLEPLRMVGVGLLLAGIGFATGAVNHLNTRLLAG
jgi:hypothetical protein